MFRLLRISAAHARRFGYHRFAGRTATGAGTTLLAGSLFWSTPKKEVKTSALDAIRDADIFYNQYMIDNAYAILRKYRKSEDPELLWRLARVVYEQGKGCKNKEERERLFREALEYAEQALAGNEGDHCFGAHKWWAIVKNSVAELDGTKSQIVASYEVKNHLERALELNPMDATTWMILGMWHFSFADLGTASRLVARAIYSTPPSSTYEEALRHFERAETIQPGFCSTNNYYMGLIHEKLGRKSDAVKELSTAFIAPCVSVDDNDIHQKAFERLRKLGIDASTLKA